MRAFLLLPLFPLLFALPAGALAQHAAPPSRADLIRSARSAAPPSVAEGATIVDLQNNMLHPGTNGWVCMPDDASVPNESPMCLDAAWREFMGAYQERRQPEFDGVGFGYMLQGDFPVSNTDPFAKGPTAENQWLVNGGPHIMMIVSEPALLEGLPTDPANGGPWVMWRATPYAHAMIPTVPRPK